jgi:hypothetical protein
MDVKSFITTVPEEPPAVDCTTAMPTETEKRCENVPEMKCEEVEEEVCDEASLPVCKTVDEVTTLENFFSFVDEKIS